MDSILRDFRFALRMLRHRPLVAVVAAASIAIGIGATTAVFSIARALLLRAPAGIEAPSRVVEIGRTTGGRGFDTFSYPELVDVRTQATPLQLAAGWRLQPLSVLVDGTARRATGLVVSQSYFEVMGVRPAVGRFFRPEEDRTPGADAVAVVAHGFWQEQLGADPGVVGRTITLNRHAFTIVGVAPRAFRGHIAFLHPDVYLPMMMMGVARPGFDDFDERRASWLQMVGRLAPGATIAQADAAVKTVMARVTPPAADARNTRSAAVVPLGPLPGPGRAVAGAFLLMIGVLTGLVLLVTAANVAGMLLARALARERETAIRLALGAGRARLVRGLVIEAIAIFAIGGGAGVALAVWATAALSALQLPAPDPIVLDVRPDPGVLAAGLVLALVTGCAFGLAPALQSSRPDLMLAIRGDAGSRAGRGSRLRRAFITAQLMLSLTLLLSAGLFLRSLQRAASVPTGFSADGVGVVSFDLSIDGYDEAAGHAVMGRLLERLRAQPGIVAAAAVSDAPLDLSVSESPSYPEGFEQADAGIGTAFAVATDGYFETVGTPLQAGRTFDARDRAGAPAVAVISRSLAERAWPGEIALGRRIRFGGPDEPLRTVVGVVADVKSQTLMETARPTIYLPHTQVYEPRMTVMARGAAYGPGLVTAMQAAIRDVDPSLSLTAVQSLADVTSLGTLPQRLAAWITSGLGLMALLLSALGVYGVIAYAVAQRTREIGVRIAVGATRADVVRLVLRDGLRLALPGLGLGLAAGLAVGRLLRGFILGVAPADPAAFVLAVAALLGAVLAASWTPARRAARIQPVHALRSE